jgi:hypothetical protein
MPNQVNDIGTCEAGVRVPQSCARAAPCMKSGRLAHLNAVACFLCATERGRSVTSSRLLTQKAPVGCGWVGENLAVGMLSALHPLSFGATNSLNGRYCPSLLSSRQEHVRPTISNTYQRRRRARSKRPRSTRPVATATWHHYLQIR